MTRQTVVHGVTLQAHDRWSVVDTPIVVLRHPDSQQWSWHHKHKWVASDELTVAGIEADDTFPSLGTALQVVATAYGVEPRRKLIPGWYTMVGYHASVIRQPSYTRSNRWMLSCYDPEYHVLPKIYKAINETYWDTRADAVAAVIEAVAQDGYTSV